METESSQIPPLPEIGQPESWYARQVKQADQAGNHHAREGYKVGQYITLGLNPRLEWAKKLRYFEHALHCHCAAPPLAGENVWLFYARLGELVREHAGAEALRLSSLEDDFWASQIRTGVPRTIIVARAQAFFKGILGERDERPEYLNQNDYEQLRILRNQWL